MSDLRIKAGKYDMILSDKFLDKTNAWDNLEEIKELFYYKFELFTAMEGIEDIELLQIFAAEVWENEKQIMKAYNFQPSYDFFRFWEMPHCSCPVLDGKELWGTKYNIYNSECIIHGAEMDN
jgi:hypothetical protein